MRRLLIAACTVAIIATACSSTSSQEPVVSTVAPITETVAPTTVPAMTPESSTTTVAPTSTVPSSTVPEATTTSTSIPTAPGTIAGLEMSGLVGVVGCSNTAGAVDGYSTLSNADVLSQGGLTGGSLGLWGNPRSKRSDRYWGLYDERRPAEGYVGTWIQLCITTREHGGSFGNNIRASIEIVVAEIHRRDPEIPIWISGVNSFAADFVCATVGESGSAIASEAADWAVEIIDGVDRGPDTGPLSRSELLLDGTCHPNEAGRRTLGEPLVAFFDG